MQAVGDCGNRKPRNRNPFRFAGDAKFDGS
jgi:hypothetical protein